MLYLHGVIGTNGRVDDGDDAVTRAAIGRGRLAEGFDSLPWDYAREEDKKRRSRR